MMARICEKRNIYTLLRMYINAAIIKNSMEILKKLKIKLPYDPIIKLLAINLKEYKSA
jgi:hypothetical protein